MAPIAVGQTLCSSSAKYTVLKFIGEGCYGKVAKCEVDLTGKLVAVKILKDKKDRGELSMMRTLSRLNADDVNVLKFYESFEYLDCTCLVFELLGTDLEEWTFFMRVHEIRPIAKQMLVALQALKGLEVIHSDIKPDNIVLASRAEGGYRCKLIDFGLAFLPLDALFGMKCQPIGYRAPEISLGLPFTQAIDMWGLGCTLAFLYLRDHLFPVNCEYQMMKAMVEMLGMPSDHQLQRGVYAEDFFIEEEDELFSRWRLLTPEEYSLITKNNAQQLPKYYHRKKSLDDLHDAELSSSEDDEEMKDTREFIDFLKQVLHMDEGKRITPEAALQHPFITMSHLSQDPDSSYYITQAQAFMAQAFMRAPTVSDVAGHDIDEARTFQSSPGAGQCGPIETHVSESPTGSVSASPSPGHVHVEEDVPKGLHLHSTEEDSQIQSHQENLHVSHCRDKTLDLDYSVNGPVVEDVPTPTPTPTPTPKPKRFAGRLRRRVGKFFSRMRRCFKLP